MLFDFGILLNVSESTKAFISVTPLSFGETVQLLNQMNREENIWRIGSIAEIQQHQKQLRDFIMENKYGPATTVWVSDVLQLETGNLNVPKFYSCDMSLSNPKNGSIALKEHKCAALFFAGEIIIKDEHENSGFV